MTWTNLAPRVFIAATTDDGRQVWGAWWTRPLNGGLTAFAEQQFHPVGGGVELSTMFKVWGAKVAPATVRTAVDCAGPVTDEVVRTLAEQAAPPTDAEWTAAMPGWAAS